MIVRSLAFARAEKALLNAPNIDELESAWAAECSDFPDESEERDYLLAIFHDRAAMWAVEAAKVLMAG